MRLRLTSVLFSPVFLFSLFLDPFQRTESWSMDFVGKVEFGSFEIRALCFIFFFFSFFGKIYIVTGDLRCFWFYSPFILFYKTTIVKLHIFTNKFPWTVGIKNLAQDHRSSRACVSVIMKRELHPSTRTIWRVAYGKKGKIWCWRLQA